MQDKRSQKQILQYQKKLLIDKGFQITIIVEIEDELLKRPHMKKSSSENIIYSGLKMQ